MKRKSQPTDDVERLTPDQERKLAYGVAQGDAGLTYGPFGGKGLSLETFLKRSKRTRRVSIRVPAVLLSYLNQEAKRFGLTPEELMVVILETHQFKDRDQKMIMLAVDRASRKSIVVARAALRDLVRQIRGDAKRAGLDKMTIAEIDAEVDATRKEHAKNQQPVKRSRGK